MKRFWLGLEFRGWQIFWFALFLPISFCVWLLWELPKFFGEFIIDEWQSAYRVVYFDLKRKYLLKHCRQIIQDYGNLPVAAFCEKYRITPDEQKQLVQEARKKLGVKDYGKSTLN
ncbi:MAG: hypothetical protein IKZ88_04965 [Neisseriaceae bacterium]|nr:hypothetical protein [Neisseriaceae bacterium]